MAAWTYRTWRVRALRPSDMWLLLSSRAAVHTVLMSSLEYFKDLFRLSEVWLRLRGDRTAPEIRWFRDLKTHLSDKVLSVHSHNSSLADDEPDASGPHTRTRTPAPRLESHTDVRDTLMTGAARPPRHACVQSRPQFHVYFTSRGHATRRTDTSSTASLTLSVHLYKMSEIRGAAGCEPRNSAVKQEGHRRLPIGPRGGRPLPHWWATGSAMRRSAR